ncbi:MAG: substrate-binding domain-containing protein [Candidatus Omnitrophota bacterium]
MEQMGLDFQSETPLYLQVKDALVKDFVSQPKNDLGKLPTFLEIANKYGVSVVTVVKAVEKLKNEGVVYSRPGKGIYLKNWHKLVENYTRPQTRTIGVTFLDMYNISSPFLSEVIKGISQESHTLNFNLQLFTTPSSNPHLEEHTLFWKNIKNKKLDGLILASRMPTSDIMLLKETDIPFVWINCDLPGEDICCILTDKFYSLNLILKHLANLGYRKISLLSSEEDYALESTFNILCSNYNLTGSYVFQKVSEKEAGYLLAKNILTADKPEVLLTRGSQLTAGALSLIAEMRLSLPKDLALIGYVSSAGDPFLPQNITVLYTPVVELAQRAARMLFRTLNGEDVGDKKPTIPTKFLIRGSCGFPLAEKKEIVISKIEELNTLSYPEKNNRNG